LRHMIDRKGSSSTNKIQTIGRFNGNAKHYSVAR
jgi:hypothetical protein